jgi:hypothetical protein
MYKGTIVESSLNDKSILEAIKIEKTYQSGSWTLFDVLVSDQEIPKLRQSLADGPWYIHLWEPGKDDIIVVFKEKIFHIKYSDKDTWKDAVAFGRSIGIPIEQLDFPID